MRLLQIRFLSDFFIALQQQQSLVTCRSTQLPLYILIAINPFLTHFGSIFQWKISQDQFQKSEQVNLLELLIEEANDQNKDIFLYLKNYQFFTKFCNLTETPLNLNIFNNFQYISKISLISCTISQDITLPHLSSLTLKNCTAITPLKSILKNLTTLSCDTSILDLSLFLPKLIHLTLKNQFFDLKNGPNIEILQISSAKVQNPIISTSLKEVNFSTIENTNLTFLTPNLLILAVTHSNLCTVEIPPSCTDVDLQFNEINTFSTKNMKNLRKLNLSINPIQQLEIKSFNLEKLYLEEIQMSNLIQLFAPKLRILSIQKNEIENIWQLLKLRKLDELRELSADFQRSEVVFAKLDQVQIYNLALRSEVNAAKESKFIEFQYLLYERLKISEIDVDRFRELIKTDLRIYEQYIIWKVLGK